MNENNWSMSDLLDAVRPRSHGWHDRDVLFASLRQPSSGQDDAGNPGADRKAKSPQSRRVDGS
jgi:hypothetical protein